MLLLAGWVALLLCAFAMWHTLPTGIMVLATWLLGAIVFGLTVEAILRGAGA